MTFKKKGIVSFVITFVLFFSGICIESVEADSLFAMSYNVIDMSTVNIYDDDLSGTVDCNIEEIEGRRNSEIIHQIRCSDNRRENGNLRYILYIEELLNIISKSEIVVERVVALPKYHSVAVLTYIHDKDGKK